MKTAILSDVHGNLVALEAVLADIATQKVGRIFCLGDTVGYGPNPRECLNVVRAHCAHVLLGNHDHAVLVPPTRFNYVAQKAIEWTYGELDSDIQVDHLSYLTGLSSSHRESGDEFHHGSPRDPLAEYVFPDSVNDDFLMADIRGRILRVAFVGHTHVPGIFYFDTSSVSFHQQATLIDPFELVKGKKTLVNVGSVGQPRDGNPQACYVIYDGTFVSFRRVSYDIAETQRRILAIPDLDPSLAARLAEGR